MSPHKKVIIPKSRSPNSRDYNWHWCKAVRREGYLLIVYCYHHHDLQSSEERLLFSRRNSLCKLSTSIYNLYQYLRSLVFTILNQRESKILSAERLKRLFWLVCHGNIAIIIAMSVCYISSYINCGLLH